jgi:hypothetical protein
MRSWLDDNSFIELENKSDEIAKMLKGLINSISYSQ